MNRTGLMILLVSAIIVAVFSGVLWLASFIPKPESAPVPTEDEVTSIDLSSLPSVPQARSGDCWKSAVCGGLTFVDCGEALDNVSYYVRTDTGAVVSMCGIACASIDKQDYCARNCPPREWTCQ